MSGVEQELLSLSRKLLTSIDAGDWKTYESLCDESITCFEPEALGQVVAGLPFHKFYFDLPSSPTKPAKQSTIASPHVRLMGNTAVVSYVRVVQKLDGSGAPVSTAAMETRVWEKKDAGWKHVHFHRSPC
ncbi:MAG: Calcium/calmodulin dependent protein kinase association-domain protein [Schlesneria sp.]|nr:Calcium/calmodulin dependent protein kinase association-domain protein [Schlesneria sp.]